MKKIFYLFTLTLVSFVLTFTSCENEPQLTETKKSESVLSGTTWQGSKAVTTVTLSFDSQTTGVVTLSGLLKGTINGTYVLEGDVITVTATSVEGDIASMCHAGEQISATYSEDKIEMTILNIEVELTKLPNLHI